MKATSEQITAIETQGRPLVVEAGAGTGKTWALVQRFIYLLEENQDWPLQSIVAITFTEKAAREMRTRLRREIEKRASVSQPSDRWQEHRRNLDLLQVSTIHSLCARILRENSIAAGLDPRFVVLDEQEMEIVREDAIQAALQEWVAEEQPALDLLSSLRIRDLRVQLSGLLSMRGTLVRLFENLGSEETLLDHWRQSLAEMRLSAWEELLAADDELQMAIREIPGVPITDPNDKLADSVRLAQEGCRLITSDLQAGLSCWLGFDLRGGRQANWGGNKEALAGLRDNLKLLRAAAKELKKMGALAEVGAMDALSARHLQYWKVLWDHLGGVYRRMKDEKQALDFDDLELLADELLAAETRQPRLQAFLDSINHLMVDEFQDTNPVQKRIAYALAPPTSGGRLFVVGDAKQSIYRFRQAQLSIFNQTSTEVRRITGEPAARLSTSFRTHAALVTAMNDLFDRILVPQGKAYSEFEAASGPLQAHRQAHPTLDAPVEMLVLPKTTAGEENINAEDGRIWEARWLAQRLLQLHRDQFQVWDKDLEAYRAFEFKDAAVLFRATTQLPLYEMAFKEAGLPYLTVSGRGYYGRQEVQDLLSLLSVLADPSDDLNLAAVLRSPLFALSDETLYRLRWHSPEGSRLDTPKPFRTGLENPPPSAQPAAVLRAGEILQGLIALAGRVDVWTLLRTALDKTQFEAVLARNDRQAGRQRVNVEKLMAIARERGGSSILEFLRRLQDLQAREAREGEALGQEPESGAVRLMSIHASKGLEFPVVVVADLGRDKKSGPTSKPYLLHDPLFGLACKVLDENGDWQTPAGYSWAHWMWEKMEEAERRRLLYVACTRAADLLVLSGKQGNSKTWLADILAAWELEPGSEEELVARDGFSIRLFAPSTPLESTPLDVSLETRPLELASVPALAAPFPRVPQVRPVAVTRLETLIAANPDDVPEIRPAIRDDQRVRRQAAPAGYQIGSMAHEALAQWDVLGQSPAERAVFLEEAARRNGVLVAGVHSAVSRVEALLRKFIQLPAYQEINQAVHRYHEVPFTLSAPVGMLHGKIDLLYQDQRGLWHLVDWKTEYTPREDLEAHMADHQLQMAVYARAAEKVVGSLPGIAIWFLNPVPRMYSLAISQVEDAWMRITGQA
jgi:ATP-dependent helicase/nuclease subunit A